MQIPYEISGTVTLAVTTPNGSSTTTLQVLPVAPSILAITSGDAPMRLDRALTIVAQNDPDLASIIDAWPALPQGSCCSPLRFGVAAAGAPGLWVLRPSSI